MNESPDGERRPRRTQASGATGQTKAWCGHCRFTIQAKFYTLKGWVCPSCKQPVHVPPSTPPPTQLGLI